MSNAKLQRLIDITAELEVRKKLYEEYDAIVMELVREGFTKAVVGDLVLELKNNFLDKNTAYKVAGVKMWDVEIITKELADKRAKRVAKNG